MITLSFIEEGIWVLEENGRNVLLKDAVQFGISKLERKFLYQQLSVTARLLKSGDDLAYLIKEGILKPLDRNLKAKKHHLWEIRDVGRGGRLIFVMLKPDTVIVSAVSKRKDSLSQAIHRGINRWEGYLKKPKE